MATCTLDDLVPRLTCSKISLEPVQSLNASTNDYEYDYGTYDVVLHLNVEDTFDEHGEGIADYIITNEDFRKYVDLVLVYSRNSAVNSFVEFLNSHQYGYREIQGVSAEYGYNNGHKALLFYGAIANTSTSALEYEIIGIADKAAFMQAVYDVPINNLLTSNPFTVTSREYNAFNYAVAITNNVMSQLSSMLGQTQFMISNAFKARYFRHLLNIVGNCNIKRFSFDSVYPANVSASEILEQRQDADGNTYYSVSIGTVTYNNTISVEDCYMHTVASFDIARMLLEKYGITDVVPFEPGVENWYFNNVEEYPILKNKRVASPMVVDFRLTERIEEIIRSDFMTPYDSTIDQISLISTEFDSENSALSSELFTSYNFVTPNPGFIGTETKNIFFVNFSALLKRKSKLAFVYNNIESQNNIDTILNGTTISSIVTDMYITRIRVDAEEPPKRVANISNIVDITNSNSTATRMYQFTDHDIEHLTDGEYVYKLNMHIRDPIYHYTSLWATATKTLSSALYGALEWINNHPHHYNELRGELSEDARIHVKDMLSPYTGFLSAQHMFNTLMFWYTGTTLSAIMTEQIDEIMTANPDYVNDPDADPSLLGQGQYFETGFLTNKDKIDRRVLQNFYRVINDLLFGVSKFVEADISNQAIDSGNVDVSGVTAREFLDYSRTWNQNPVRANLDYRMMLQVTERQSDHFSVPQIDNEFKKELQKHYGSTSYSDSTLDKANFFTPRLVGEKVINYYNIDRETTLPDSKVEVIEASVKKPARLKSEIISAIYDYNSQDYDGAVANIKNDSAIFESLLGELGGTVRNLTAEAINTEVVVNWEETRQFVFGLDHGENSRSDKFPSEEELEAIALAEEERREIKENLLLEKIKLEDLTMSYLVDSKGHHLLDRRKFTQGEREFTRLRAFNLSNLYFNVIHRDKPYPRLLINILSEYYRQASDSTVETSPIKVLGSKFVVDNTFLVYYLDSFDANMNPRWVELIRGEMGNVVMAASLSNRTRILCKLERFRMTGERTVSGQGSSSDLEITNKYFYLTL